MERIVTIPLAETDMSNLRGKARPVVIVADRELDPRVGAQLQMLNAAAHGLGERDMPVMTDFRAGQGFEVRLIGKDGTVKRRFADPVPAETLFAIVDDMPMRQDEMRD
ncbi:DUF4174 domain-containing protein [uncultured Paracoccus sp.]|uniref:DUF4174 domain-containing protein n=1 Tax=uncultured Paracoccus sp. TaxID=189685 RepID=UPI0026287D98|nr:DUF4174 domain-containing protein [uncultured Paracoccus sp.]